MSPFFGPGGPRVLFPPPSDREGIVAMGGELTPDFLLSAYWQGVFPWFDDASPILWWNPDPRFVLFPEQLHISRRLGRTLRSGRYTVTVDRAFEEVIRACSRVPRPGQNGTWITEGMIEGYCELHRLGHAHSFESWCGDTLAGGLYGVSVGSVFCGESMFARRSDASKTAFVAAVHRLTEAGYRLIDCQVYTDHLAGFGAADISRKEYLSLLSRYRDRPAEALV